MTSIFHTTRRLAAVITTAVLLGTGCTNDAITSFQNSGSDSEIAPSGSKLRHAQLLYQKSDHLSQQRATTASWSGGTTSASTDQESVTMIVELTGGKLTADKFLSRYKLLSRYEYETVFNGLAVEIDPARLDSFLAAIESDPDVVWAEPDIFVSVPGAGAVNYRSGASEQFIPWGIDRIGATQSSAASGDGIGSVDDVEIYVLDTGIQNRDVEVIENYNYAQWGDTLYTEDTVDKTGHGTHVAATAAGRDDNAGIVGVAPGAKVRNLRVLNREGDTDIATAIHVVDLITARKLANPSLPIVVNMSFGADIGTTEYNALDHAIVKSIEAGVVYVLSAGNDGIDVSTVTPAHVTEAITVGAYDPTSRFASFSNFGPGVDILAPGVDVLSMGIKKVDTVLMSGTSMAAPHVSGAAALYLSSNPAATPAAVRDAILAHSRTWVWDVPTGTTQQSVWVGDL